MRIFFYKSLRNFNIFYDHCHWKNTSLKFISKSVLALLLQFTFTSFVQAQNCGSISPYPCSNIKVSLPFGLEFYNPVANSIQDSNNQGTGFTMVQKYSSTRLAADGAPTIPVVPGYTKSSLRMANGLLHLTASKGISYLNSNNQINALGVEVDTHNKIEIITYIINPYQGNEDQQAGIWFGLNDKTFIKLSISENKIELRKEVNDLSNKTPGSGNLDQRVTGIISGLESQRVGLKLIIDPVNNTAAGFYTIDRGVTYTNVGAGYPAAALSISEMGLTNSSVYAGIYASYRNGTTPVIYSFNRFQVKKSLQFESAAYNFELADNASLNSAAGTIRANVTDESTISYSILSGNSNKSFSINSRNGQILVNRKLNYHTQPVYNLKVLASAGQMKDTSIVKLNITSGQTISEFNGVNWGTTASQPYRVSEAQGEVVNNKLYSFGGFDSQKTGFTPTKRAYKYDPVTNKWTSIADLPHTPNGTGFGGVTHAGFTNDGTDIYMAGGYTSNSSGTGQTFGVQQVWKYNVVANTYSKLPDLPVRIAAGQLEYLNGKLHHIGGTNAARTEDLGNHYELDLNNLAAGWKTRAPLPNPRQHSGSVVFEGKIYYIGGQRGHDSELATSKDVHRYDPTSDTWTKLADLLAPENYGLGHISSSIVIAGDKIVVLGGESVHHTATNMVSAYSPATNSWTSLTPLPQARFSGVAALLNGVLYYTGGSKTNSTFKGMPVTMANTRSMQAEISPNDMNAADPFSLKKMTVFPNPAINNTINLQLENFGVNEKVNITVLDSFGKIIQQTNCVTNEKGVADLSFVPKVSLSKNTYMIKAETATGSCMNKLIVP
jgi:N-acetylneuraminic acid mutarotase